MEFFKKREHAILPSASLVPENDPSVLFTTAGMQPLVPYLLGEKHPQGKRLANVQKCVRTQDIDEVGDNTHDTFFEMLGNWSLGDYWKEDAIKWSYEFLTSKEEGLGLDPKRLYITCFEGNADAPRDDESAKIWESCGVPKNRIYFLGVAQNWWQAGENGPCGPDTEMHYDISKDGLGDLSKEEFLKASDDQQIIEIWNDVFMEYVKKDGKVTGKLSQKNVDTGAGLERLAMVMQKVNNVFSTDLFEHIVKIIDALSFEKNERARRIVADHIRTAVFMITDGVIPSNTDQGYVLRRLLRRAIRYSDVLKMKPESLYRVAQAVTMKYMRYGMRNPNIFKQVFFEEKKFRATLAEGLKEFERLAHSDISGKDAFLLFSTYGFPLEMTIELAAEKKLDVDIAAFAEEMKKHQELSRTGAAGKFKGGLAGHSDKEIQYHTATHLLNAALHEVLGAHVEQKGSNITPERLRFDFFHNKKMTDEEKKKVEDFVNEKIAAGLPVNFAEMKMEEAKKLGAIGVFEDKYGEVVKVYSIGDNKTGIVSQELCGGPHVKNTSELKGTFKIQKEEAVSAGVRRIKAVLE